MPRINITETILRDAHQSLIATRMRTADMLPACARLDRVGFWSLEVWGGATFDACLRFLKEDPWERLRTLRRALPDTRLQMLLRGQNLLGYRHYADDVVCHFVARAADNGIDVFRIFDALNDTRNVATAIAAVKKAGKHAQGAISYTTSPVHTTGQFVSVARELADMGCDSIVIKDMAGLLTPETTATLVTALREGVGLPIQVHSHATAGISEMCHYMGAKSGCFGIDTAISAFAGGASHAPTESMVAAFKGTEYDTGLDLELLQEIGFYFREIRGKYRQFESEFTGLDTRVHVNQVPGGMISNLVNQVRAQGAIDRFNDVLAEIPRVREDLGFPPLVTPTSQIVGSQAVLNILTGERYKTITNEVKLYLQGHYGKAPGKVNETVRDIAIGKAQVIDCRPADLIDDEMDDLREQARGLAESEEDVLIIAMFPEIGREFLEQRRDDKLVPEALEPPADEAESLPQTAPIEFNATLHGESYHIKITGTGHRRDGIRPFFLTVDGIPEEVVLETLDEIETNGNGGAAGSAPRARPGSHRPRASMPGHVTTAIPGVVVDVMVAEGAEVKAGDPLLVMEAMKMETEIQAPVSGTVKTVYIAKGDSVNPDETLVEIE